MTTLELSDAETEVLREVLEAQLPQLMIESARTDTHDFREYLQRRRVLLEQVLEQLPRKIPVQSG
jgi:hypothetical protein